VIQDIAKRLGRPASEVALRWIIQQGVVAIPMTTKEENARSNLRTLEFELSDADMAAITALTRQHRRLISPAGMRGRWD
jgi:diketogulonate reductase-like aldo/keto reductase